MTCLPLDTQYSFSPTRWAAIPDTPVSISSKIMVETGSFSAKTFFMASMIRLSSPPEAILLMRPISSPALADMINRI